MNYSTSSSQSGSQSESPHSGDTKGAAKGMNVQYEQVESLDKVREILFGTQSKNIENRFQKLEDKINRESEDIKNDIKVRLDGLEEFMKKELETVSQQARVEQADRRNAGKEIGQELKELQKFVEKKCSYLEEQSLNGQKDLRQQLFDQGKTLSNEIQNKNDSIKEALDQGSQELNEIKVDRVLLAELLMKLAVDLNGGQKVSQGK